MKANEVNQYRVGNIVTSGGELLIVESILGGTLRLYLHSLDKEILFQYPVNQIVGLPLSEEWLVKSEFEEYHTNPRLERFFVLKKGYYPFQIYQDRNGRFWYTPNTPLDFVHRLQNIYHGLYCEELEFKL